MDCEQALALISSRIDREITASESVWLSDHLRCCGACRATAEAYALQHAKLKRAFEPRRADVVATMDRVNTVVCGSQRRTPRQWRFLKKPGFYLAAAVVCWIVIAIGWHFATSPRPQMPSQSGNSWPPRSSAGWNTSPTGQSDRLLPQPLTKSKEPVPLQQGQHITTALGERRREKLPDGSTVFLNENTALTVDFTNNVTLQNGTAYFEAASQANQSPSGLVVMTPDRYVVGQGTKFAVQTEPQGTFLLAVEGDISAGNIQAQTPAVAPFVLHSGEILAPQATVATRNPRLSHVLAWTHDLVVANDTPLVPASAYDGGALIAVDANGQEAKLSLRKYHVDVHIEDGFARTTIDQTYFNYHPWRLEGTFFFPLPPDASLSRLAMYVDGQLNEGGMVEREYGRTVYQRIVNGQRDPALLEWVDGSTFKMRVFPLEGRQEKRIILSYTQRVPTLYGRSQYRFPAGHSLQTVDAWSFHALVKNGANFTAASPTHPALQRSEIGGDLVLDDAAKNCKVERDVVLELTDPSFVAEDRDSIRFSCAAMDGNDYLMMRFRPQLPPQKKRERRDWIFLYESSADRDPLLARAQVEIVRGMLQNAEPDDTFRLFAVSNRVTPFVSPAPPAMSGNSPMGVPIFASNIAEGVAFLEHAHLVGALDLGVAFRTAEQGAALTGNPYLVHIGSGYTAMGTPQDDLAKLLSTKAKYIGVGVGKHWNRAFMKQCAEKTGGYYTQINPDESISWRTFDLMATLNTPRLLDVKVADASQKQGAEQNGPRFLLENNAIAQGEELCAVAQLRTLPEALTITGLLDGARYERTVHVERVADKAAYIPRTWAKLEIDRLLAEDARKNKNAIVDLSKSLYVMTPFTSLLVLENEAMYQQYKVDRGRKDHWGLYTCPDKIPVVYEPDPTMPTDVRNAPKGLKATANQVRQTVCIRAQPSWLVGTDYDKVLGKPRSSSGVGGVIFLARDVAPGNSTDGIEDWYGYQGVSGHVDSVLWAKSDQLKGSTDHSDRATLAAEILDKDIDEPAILFPSPAQIRMPRTTDYFLYATNNLDEIGNHLDGVTSENAFRVLSDDASNNWSLGLQAKTPFGFRDTMSTELLGNLQSARRAVLGNEFLLYSRLHFSGDQRLFTDLLSYAPGLNTNQADILAVLEAEAMPDLRQAPGSISPEARKLINGARTGFWQKLTLPADKDQPQQVLLFDGAGRYAYERQPTMGLHELVVCDGATIVHQYPEIGLAGRRTASRFHRAELTDIVPWLLPPAEDLARGVDLQCVDNNTIALVPHWLRDARKPNEKQPSYRRLHLVFEEGRFAERRLVEMPALKIVARECYDGNGGVTLYDGAGKELSKTTRKLSAAAAPDLRPDLSQFVVLSLPYRSRAHVMDKLDLISSQALDSEDNGCFQYLDSDACLQLLAALAAERNAAEAQLLYRRCFRERGDQRRGLFTLLAAAGVNLCREPGLRAVFAQTPDDELLQYLLLSGNTLYRYAQQRFVLNRGQSAGQGGSFLRQLLDAQALLLRWEAPRGRMIDWHSRLADVQRSTAFIAQHPRDVLGLALLQQMQDRTEASSEAEKLQRNLTLADQWRRLADANGNDYRAHFEQAALLNQAHRRPEAEELFERLYANTLKTGVLPPIDRRFVDTLQSLDSEPVVDEWNRLMLATGQQFIEKKQYSAVLALATQCRQLNEPALADSLLGDLLKAVKDAPDGWKIKVLVIQFYARAGELARADALLHELLPIESQLAPSAAPGTGGAMPGLPVPLQPASSGPGAPPFGRPPNGQMDQRLAQRSDLWRVAAQVAERRGHDEQAAACLETALDLEFRQLPEVIDLRGWRVDYGKLLDHYRQQARSAAALNMPPPADLEKRTLRAIDRYRAHDPESNEACKKAADVFALLGQQELAWDYYTTWMMGRGLDAGRWQYVAAEMNQTGAYQFADRALSVAAAVEPTNAEVVWERAKNLRQAGRGDEADALMRRLANEKWPERYQGIHANAQYYLKKR